MCVELVAASAVAGEGVVRQSVSTGAYPSHLSGGHTGHQGIGRYIVGHYRTGSYHGAPFHGVATYNGAVGS